MSAADRVEQVKTLTIDGQRRQRARGPDDPRRRARERHLHPDALPPRRPVATSAPAGSAWSRSKGVDKLLPACVTRSREGMEVITDSERLQRYRRTIVELLFAERNHVCSVCVLNGHCELQNLAQELGMTHVHLPYLYPKLPVDASHERFVLDHNRCILCTRCVRVCDEIEGAHTWDVIGARHRLPASSPT